MDHANNHRQALIHGIKSPALSNEAKLEVANRYLGSNHVLAGGKHDWTRPTVLTAWIAGRSGAAQRIAGL